MGGEEKRGGRGQGRGGGGSACRLGATRAGLDLPQGAAVLPLIVRVEGIVLGDLLVVLGPHLEVLLVRLLPLGLEAPLEALGRLVALLVHVKGGGRSLALAFGRLGLGLGLALGTLPELLGAVGHAKGTEGGGEGRREGRPRSLLLPCLLL